MRVQGQVAVGFFFFKLLRIEGKSKSLGGLPFYVEANTDLSRCRVSGKAS